MKITHRDTGAVLFEGGLTTMRETVATAVNAGAYLAGANLDGAYLVRANLGGANLDGAYLAGANLAGANLAGANLAGANLVRANLVRANLDGANLDGAYLDGAYLFGANLDGANLVRANLGALFIAARATRSDGYEFFLWSSILGGDVIRAGCRTFSLAQFRDHVAKRYPGTPKASETSAILDYLESQLPAARQRKAVELGETL
jgi:uncharacterized protein YjbI with pentapeptide repeats